MHAIKLSICLFLISTAALAEEGLTLGVGAVTVNDSNGPFPVVSVAEQPVMLLPNISYRWNEFSVSANGLGWHREWTPELKSDVSIGYPSSGVVVAGERGWLRYGGSAEIRYGDGLSASVEANAAGISVKRTEGLESRAGQWQQQLSFSAPVWIGDSGSIILGKVATEWQSANFSAYDYELTSASELNAYQQQYVIGLFSVWSLTDRATLLLSGDVYLPDEELRDLNEQSGRNPFSVFTMFSYAFGRR